MIRLQYNTQIGPYRVERFIKDGLFNSSYVVTDASGRRCFLKLFDPPAVPKAWKVNGEVEEIVNSRNLSHPHVISYIADGRVTVEGREYPYLVMQFFQGALLSEYLQEGRQFKGQEIRAIIGSVLKGLVHLRDVAGLNHNDITPRNILLEETPEGLVPKIIDLGHAHGDVVGGNPPFPMEDLNLLYTAPEALDGSFSAFSDSFSVAALLFTLICGQAPWYRTLDETSFPERKAEMKEARRRELIWPAALHASDRVMQNLVLTGLQMDPARRPLPERMLELIYGGPTEERHKTAEPGQPRKPASTGGLKATTDGTELKKTMQRNAHSGGFADVAGMENLKKMLTERVIWVLRDREKALKYKLLPPNGMLLYGPPGCGKTYFAEKFAEESHFNYMVVNGSDLGSTYIHGTQGKIAALFQEAAAKAPTVLCFDEFDSFVPARGSEAARHRPEEVNEFLSQLNNCAQRGIFVIGTTNRRDMIDPAVLRKGRLDLQIEVPAPELETRRQMFLHYLKGRPLADDIDVDRLAALTDGYASSDIAFIVNEAALVAALADVPVAQRHLEDSVRCNPSSLGQKTVRTPIGYK
ncbi:MAG: AAA family ATPase [Bacteroidales bacterium]|nr:AAA family ATPase [Bacteroidales bacterium]